MKIVILLAISFVAVMSFELTEENAKKLQEYHKFCVADSGAEALFEKAAKGETIENDEKFACYLTCLFKKYETLNEEGEIDWDKVRAHWSQYKLPQEKIEEMCNACKHVDGTGCQKGYNLYKCLKPFQEAH